MRAALQRTRLASRAARARCGRGAQAQPPRPGVHGRPVKRAGSVRRLSDRRRGAPAGLFARPRAGLTSLSEALRECCGERISACPERRVAQPRAFAFAAPFALRRTPPAPSALRRARAPVRPRRRRLARLAPHAPFAEMVRACIRAFAPASARRCAAALTRCPGRRVSASPASRLPRRLRPSLTSSSPARSATTRSPSAPSCARPHAPCTRWVPRCCDADALIAPLACSRSGMQQL